MTISLNALPQAGEDLSEKLNQPRTLVMGVLNITPDSFSDGGTLYPQDNTLLETVEAMLEAGVDILDIGGESTRPGAQSIDEAEELKRVIPAIESIKQQFPNAFISIDTRKAVVARAAIKAGAQMINDVSGLIHDPQMASIAAETGAWLVIMHAQGTPETMQDNPHYDDVTQEVLMFLDTQVEKALAAGVSPQRIIIDPGFGFGKTNAHNITLMQELSYLKRLRLPILVGLSRKSFLTMNNPNIAPTEREALTAASTALAIEHGARIVRIHDAQTQIPVVRLIDQMLSNI